MAQKLVVPLWPSFFRQNAGVVLAGFRVLFVLVLVFHGLVLRAFRGNTEW